MNSICLKIITAVILMIFSLPLAGSDHTLFVPEGMELRVQFWINVFSTYTEDQKIIHDADKPERIYRVLDLATILGDKKVAKKFGEEIVKQEMERISSIFKMLGSDKIKLDQLTQEELRLYRLFGKNPGKYVFLKASKRIRVQNGMKEPFIESLIRSGRYLPTLKTIFIKHGLPQDLIYLPHIESSFHPHARSTYGAVGMWQFTRSTGKHYFTIRSDVDERRDPILAAEAAAKLLKDNLKILGSWPLAITAYNHGTAGLLRAIRRLKTKDLVAIINRYRSRRFGFASKNFYAEFLAATRIAKNPSIYFGDILLDPPMRFHTVTLTKDQNIDSVLVAYGIRMDDFKRFNPALRPPIYRSEKPVPKGYRLRIPLNPLEWSQTKSVASVEETEPNETTDRSFGQSRNLFAAFADQMKSLIASFRPEGDTSNGTDQHLESSDGEIGSGSKEKSVLPEPSQLLLTLKPIYTVKDKMIVVQSEETLGHFADWLELPTQRLRDLNNIRYGETIRVGQSLLLDFSHVGQTIFEERRFSYHQTIRNEFLKNYQVGGSKLYTIQPGETLWTVANHRFGVPLWLLMDYNGDKNLHKINPGEKVIIPIVERTRSVNGDLVGGN